MHDRAWGLSLWMRCARKSKKAMVCVRKLPLACNCSKKTTPRLQPRSLTAALVRALALDLLQQLRRGLVDVNVDHLLPDAVGELLGRRADGGDEFLQDLLGLRLRHGELAEVGDQLRQSRLVRW